MDNPLLYVPYSPRARQIAIRDALNNLTDKYVQRPAKDKDGNEILRGLNNDGIEFRNALDRVQKRVKKDGIDVIEAMRDEPALAGINLNMGPGYGKLTIDQIQDRLTQKNVQGMLPDYKQYAEDEDLFFKDAPIPGNDKRMVRRRRSELEPMIEKLWLRKRDIGGGEKSIKFTDRFGKVHNILLDNSAVSGKPADYGLLGITKERPQGTTRAEYIRDVQKLYRDKLARQAEDDLGIPRPPGGTPIRRRELDIDMGYQRQKAAQETINNLYKLDPPMRELYEESEEVIEAYKDLRNPLREGSPYEGLNNQSSAPNGQGGPSLVAQNRQNAQAPNQGTFKGVSYQLGRNIGELPAGGAVGQVGMGGQKLPPIREALADQLRRKQGKPTVEVDQQRDVADWEATVDAREALVRQELRNVNQEKFRRQRALVDEARQQRAVMLDFELRKADQKRQQAEYEAKLKYDKEIKEREEIIEALKGTGNLWQTFFGNLFEF